MALFNDGPVRLEFNSAGFRALLSGDEMRDAIYGVASSIAGDAGEGFEARPFYGAQAGRWMATVDADTIEARRAEASDKTLSRAAAQNRGVL